MNSERESNGGVERDMAEYGEYTEREYREREREMRE